MEMDNVEFWMREFIKDIGPEKLADEMRQLVQSFFEKYPKLHMRIGDPVTDFWQVYRWAKSELNH